MRATKAQVRQRVEEFLRIKLDGAALWDLKEFVAERVGKGCPVWGDKPLCYSSLYRYSRLADRLIEESSRAGRRKLYRRHLAQRRNLYAKAVSAGDLRTALACLDSEADLLGLRPPKDAELVKRLEKAEAALAALATPPDPSPWSETEPARQAAGAQPTRPGKAGEEE
jgi:hypothetical protein